MSLPSKFSKTNNQNDEEEEKEEKTALQIAIETDNIEIVNALLKIKNLKVDFKELFKCRAEIIKSLLSYVESNSS